MSRKKILFFIVEGSSEYFALANALEEIFSSEKVVVRVTGGDITSDSFSTPQNIITKIVEQIKEELGKGYSPSDFCEIVQLVDTDGVFIAPECVIKTEGNDVYYESDNIQCKNPATIIKRNNQKSLILNRLINLPYVWKSIPYSVYYFSSNFDHVLYNNANLTREEKTDLAALFAKKYKNNPNGVISFFSTSEFSVHNSYGESWRFIKAATNSLHRHSNFHLLFSENAKNNSPYSAINETQSSEMSKQQ